MDNLQLREEIVGYQKISEELENQLKILGIELSDLPDESLMMLKEYADIKFSTKLADIDLTYLMEYCCQARQEQIKKNVITQKLEADIRNVEIAIEKEISSIKSLQEIASSMNSRIISSAEMEKDKNLIEKQIEGIRKKQEQLDIPTEFKIDDLITKVKNFEKTKNEKAK